MLRYCLVYSSLLPMLAAVCILAYVPYGIYVTRLYGRRSGLYHLAKCALGLCVASLLYLTIFFFYPNITFHPAQHHLNLHAFIWVTECYDAGPAVMAAQLLLNIAMFLPLGFLLPIAAHKLRAPMATAAVVLLSTVGIETFQYFIGRSADIDDVIMNFLGGILGYGCYVLLNRYLSNIPWWNAMLTGDPLTPGATRLSLRTAA